LPNVVSIRVLERLFGVVDTLDRVELPEPHALSANAAATHATITVGYPRKGRLACAWSWRYRPQP